MNVVTVPDEIKEVRAANPKAAVPTLQATLVLGDGTVFTGVGVGPVGAVTGELVATTALSGYQEALTDPSYRGQLLLFTSPLIGSYGVLPFRSQSRAIHPRALLCHRLSPAQPADAQLLAWLQRHHVPAIWDLDSRAIAVHLRRHGTLPAALALSHPDRPPQPAQLQALACADPYDRSDLVAQVTPPSPHVLGTGDQTVVLVDCGSKQALADVLVAQGFRVTVVPASTDAAQILALAPAGVLVSNGPGNPAMAHAVVQTIRTLLGRVPLFGVCLGHQLLALACGAATTKLRFGHRGTNHPVLEVATGRAAITTQNHGYAVDLASVPQELIVTHRNLHDGSVEGLRHRSLPAASLQFHPEGAPGPTDAARPLLDWLHAL